MKAKWKCWGGFLSSVLGTRQCLEENGTSKWSVGTGIKEMFASPGESDRTYNWNEGMGNQDPGAKPVKVTKTLLRRNTSHQGDKGRRMQNEKGSIPRSPTGNNANYQESLTGSFGRKELSMAQGNPAAGAILRKYRLGRSHDNSHTLGGQWYSTRPLNMGRRSH